MKGIIIFGSCYGSTEQYASWISEKLPLKKVNYEDVTDDEISQSDIVVIGSWVLANKLFLAKWLKEKTDLLKNKTLYIYSVSGAEPGDACLKRVFEDSLDPALLSNAKTYQCGGKREVEGMSGFHKFMLWIAATFIEKDPQKKADIKKYVNNVSFNYISPLIEDIKNILISKGEVS